MWRVLSKSLGVGDGDEMGRGSEAPEPGGKGGGDEGEEEEEFGEFEEAGHAGSGPTGGGAGVGDGVLLEAWTGFLRRTRAQVGAVV